ncbi:MAG: NAD(P)-binding protein [Methylocapsa sp.]|nr:NAD(P)-binding protein [Methylocapsa sp.]
MPIDRFDAAILGAGVSGLASAYFLARSGLRVCLLDDYPMPGGNHISRDFSGFTFDIGSIFFYPGNPQFKMFPGSDADFVPVDLTLGRITPQGHIRSYPLSIKDEILKQPWRFLRFALSLGRQKFLGGPGTNAESYAIYYLGAYLYRESGLRNYLLRFYGIDPQTISLHFVERRMNLTRLTSLRRAAQDLVKRMRRNPAAAVKPHAIARPVGGFSNHYKKVAEQLHSLGVEIRCAAGLKAVCKTPAGLQIDTACGTLFAKRVINTLPLQMVFGLLGSTQAVELSSTKLCTLCCSFAGDRGFKTVVLYNFHDKGAWKRLTMHSDYYGKHAGREFFDVEVTLGDKRPKAESLFEDFAAHTNQLGLFRGDLRLEGSMDLDFAYPVCDLKAEERRLRLIDLLAQSGIETIGRQGLFDYIPHSAIAIEAARERYGRDVPWVPYSGPPNGR